MLDPRLAAHLPFAVRPLRDGVRGFAEAARPEGFDVLLFESSGMPRRRRRFRCSRSWPRDASTRWGSRRLSVRDIEESCGSVSPQGDCERDQLPQELL